MSNLKSTPNTIIFSLGNNRNSPWIQQHSVIEAPKKIIFSYVCQPAKKVALFSLLSHTYFFFSLRSQLVDIFYFSRFTTFIQAPQILIDLCIDVHEILIDRCYLYHTSRSIELRINKIFSFVIDDIAIFEFVH